MSLNLSYIYVTLRINLHTCVSYAYVIVVVDMTMLWSERRNACFGVDKKKYVWCYCVSR